MDCKSIEAYFDDFLTGELDPTLEIQIHEHLATCAKCQREIKKRAAVFDVLRESRTFEPPPEVLWRIRTKLGIPQETRKMLWRVPEKLMYATVAFLLGTVVMRAVDVLFFVEEQIPPAEMRYAPAEQLPYSDTVQFYAVPAEHLQRGPQ